MWRGSTLTFRSASSGGAAAGSSGNGGGQDPGNDDSDDVEMRGEILSTYFKISRQVVDEGNGN